MHTLEELGSASSRSARVAECDEERVFDAVPSTFTMTGPQKRWWIRNWPRLTPGLPTWTLTPQDAKDGRVDVATISGLGALKNGRGTLVLTGTGSDGGKLAEVRTTVARGAIFWRCCGKLGRPGEEFEFRHAYTLSGRESRSLRRLRGREVILSALN